jgi:hypothetical protein
MALLCCIPTMACTCMMRLQIDLGSNRTTMTFHCWATKTAMVNEATAASSSDWYPTWIPRFNGEAEWAGKDAVRGFARGADRPTGCAMPFYPRARIHRRRRRCSCTSRPHTRRQSRAPVSQIWRQPVPTPGKGQLHREERRGTDTLAGWSVVECLTESPPGTLK